MRLYVRSAERRPDPPPMHTDERAAIRWITAGWAIAFVVTLLLRDRLAADGRGWWVWTPLVGVLLGGYGLRWLSRMNRRRDQ